MLGLEPVLVLPALSILLFFAYVVLSDFLVALHLFQFLILALELGALFGIERLKVQLARTILLLFIQLDLLLVVAVEGGFDDEALAIPLLLLTDTLLLFFIHLFDEHVLAVLAGLDAPLLSRLIILNLLETFDFHHALEGLLLVNILVLKLIALLNLLVSNVVDLAEHHAFVHFLHVVRLFIELLLVQRQQALGAKLLILAELDAVGHALILHLHVMLLHLLFLDFCGRLLHFQRLFVHDRLGHVQGQARWSVHRALDPIQLLLRDDHAVSLFTLLSTLTDVAYIKQKATRRTTG